MPGCREELLRAARRKEIDVIVVWRLDRWGRSLVDLIAALQELTALRVQFTSLSEALDLTTPSGRAFAGMRPVNIKRASARRPPRCHFCSRPSIATSRKPAYLLPTSASSCFCLT